MMCDTLGKRGEWTSLFAKNSDRSPNEVQVTQYHPGRTGLSGEVKCTYVSVPQAKRTHGVLLSRPAWMWGAEMGVNDYGVCIGNEAVFTKGAYGKTGLTGMDMVRLALERSANAAEALKNIISWVEHYGQGGNCGYDHSFYYDNAFLIMDRESLFVLETAGNRWVYKEYDRVSISNGLSIGGDGDGYTDGTPVDFRKIYAEPVYTTFSGSACRRNQTGVTLEKLHSVADCMAALRQHDPKVKNPFAAGTVKSVCMHYGGLVGDHTTSSMVVSLEPGQVVAWVTGSSLPCVSLFKPWMLWTEPVLPVTGPGEEAGVRYWLAAEEFRRGLLGKRLPQEFFTLRDALQERWVKEAQDVSRNDFPEFSRRCLAEEEAFFTHWKRQKLENAPCAPGFRGRWAKKTAVLRSEHPEVSLK